MQAVHVYCVFAWIICFLLQDVNSEYVTLSHNGPVVLGGTITFTANVYTDDNKRPLGNFKYRWKDSATIPHEYESESTTNTTTQWSISYPRETYPIGTYEVEVTLLKFHSFFWWPLFTACCISFNVTSYLNGNITILQSNKTLENPYVSSALETKIKIDVRKGDYDYITKKATSVSTYWFIDCKYYGQTNDLTFNYNFTNPNTTHRIGGLVLASYEPPPTVPPLTTSTANPASSSTTPSNNLTSSITTTMLPGIATSTKLVAMSTETSVSLKPEFNTTTNIMEINNVSLPYICLNSSIIPLDPNKTYGYFEKEVNVRAPIANISVEGTNWIQPWDMLFLNVTCKGSGPFYKCLQFNRGEYNVTGNETCNNGAHLYSCNFSISRYFLEPNVYTVLVILNNDVSKQIYPIRINIYTVTTKPQLSVIVVPVSCTLIAVVLIIFGVAYYIQSRARFTVEVADFDFGQNNPEIEYKTFRERLRDSFNNAVKPGNKRISGYKPLDST